MRKRNGVVVLTVGFIFVLFCMGGVGLVSPIMGIERPVDPFQKAKSLALKEGIPEQGKTSTIHTLNIEGWGSIFYVIERETIMLMKGTAGDHSGVQFDGRYGKYSVSRVVKGSKPEITFVERSGAMDIANRYLKEIEAVRGNK